MTYRRLFHFLLIASTLLLAVAWWGSFTTGVGMLINAPSPPVSVSVDLVRADIRLYASSVPASGSSIDIGPYPASDLPEDAEENLTGNFEWFTSSTPEEQLDPSQPYAASFYLRFPVWVIYLLFVAIIFVFTWMMERRSRRRVGDIL